MGPVRWAHAALIAAAVAAAAGLVRGQETPLLREAAPGEAWILRPTIGIPEPRPAAAAAQTPVADSSAPTAPANLVAQSSGLFKISASWSASTDAESGIDYYAF